MARNGLWGFFLGGCSFFHIRCKLALSCVQRVQPTLSTGRESSPVTQLHYLRLREFAMQVGPQCVVCQFRIPEHRVGITQSDLFSLRESVGLQVILQVV